MFDCVEKNIVLLLDDLQIFDAENSPIDYRYINTSLWGPRGKKCALTVEPKKLSMLEETLFGKDNSEQGSMMQAMREFDNRLTETDLFQALKDIFNSLSSQREQLNLSELKKGLNLPPDQEIVLFFPVIRSKSINDGNITRLAEVIDIIFNNQ